MICCSADYGNTSGSIEEISSPGVSPLPGYYSAAEQSPQTSTGSIQKGRPRKRKLSEVTRSEMSVSMRLAAGGLGNYYILYVLIYKFICVSILYVHLYSYIIVVK